VGKVFFILFILGAIGIQFIPVSRSNPAEKAPIQVDEEVMKIFKSSCYDCHSNTTQWPWYSYVAPTSFLVTHHVNHGREYLNFSDWNTYGASKKAHLADEIVEEVTTGKMPLTSYELLHPHAAINAQQLSALKQWARGFKR